MNWITILENKKEFGEYLFGEFEKFYNKQLEKDTTKEKSIFKVINDFVAGKYVGKKKPKILLTALKTLLSKKSEYPDILKHKDDGVLFRGIQLSFNEFDKLQFTKQKPLNKDIKNKYGKDIPTTNYTYKSRDEIQSWTPKFENAAIFAYGDPNKVGLVLCCDISEDETLFSTKFLNAISKIHHGGEENEVIRISKSPLICKAITDIKNLNKEQLEKFNGKDKPKSKPIVKATVKPKQKDETKKVQTFDDILGGLSQDKIKLLLKKAQQGKI